MPASLLKTLDQVRAKRDLSVFDLTSIDDLTDQDIELILELAQIFQTAPSAKLELLMGTAIVNAFFENSTRTRLSFELAGKELGADTVNISANESSVKKGESSLDTIQTLAALGPKIIVMRTSESGLPSQLKKYSAASIVNAGDGRNEHPSQALLDARTMLDQHGSLNGKTVTIVGDLLHSRVFGSLRRILPRLGAKIRVSCPETLLPPELDRKKIPYCSDVEEALVGADVVYALRVQEERGAKGYISSLKEYFRLYGITPKRFALAAKNAILMHPGPVIRDTDLHFDLLKHERCHVLKQVANGLAVRKAILWLLGDRKDGKVKSSIRG